LKLAQSADYMPPRRSPAPPASLPDDGKGFPKMPLVRRARLAAALCLAVAPAVLPAGALPQVKHEPPLPDGTYRAERGYNAPRDICPAKIDITEVKVSAGTIEFLSGGSLWFGMINEKTGVIRIETTGIKPRPTAELNIRGHHLNAQLFSTVCGAGYFRVLR
jgi:hypothetical protein